MAKTDYCPGLRMFACHVNKRFPSHCSEFVAPPTCAFRMVEIVSLLQISREMQICLNTEIKILELLLSNPCLLHQNPHTTAEGKLAPKPEHLRPPCHVYSTAALAIATCSLSVPTELVGVKVLYAIAIMFSKTV